LLDGFIITAAIGGIDMLLIAHRGNVSGPRTEFENNPIYIDKAIELGYDVEIDVWFVNNKLFLGHDEPQYKIDLDYLRNDRFWCHCKNLAALRLLIDNDVHCFFHEDDEATLTSERYIWTFPNKELMERSICVMPERGVNGDIEVCAGICSDHVEDYR